MRKILIIDDEVGVIRYYKKLLESEGYSVLTAKNAAEGNMAMLTARDIDLIMLDINMPQVDGVYMWDVIQEYNDKLKVLIFSVRNIEEQKRCLPLATDYFDKSQSVEILLNKVSSLLGSKKPETMRASS